MAVDELVMSILAQGFFAHEPLYVVEENGRNIVVEGNRRLAAVKSILNPETVKNRMAKFLSKRDERVIQELKDGIPIIKLSSRKEAWRYIGFKHVNGAAKWGYYAKAQYIYSVHSQFKISLEDIAEQIGDSNNTVKKLYQGLMVIKEAESRVEFDPEDTYSGSLYFSHLYTAMGYDNVKKYLGLQLLEDGNVVIPKENNEQLKNFMLWLFGSGSEKVEPAVKSQNPDLRNLNKVLGNKEATIALLSSASLDEAFEIARGGSAIFEESLINAKRSIQKALANSPFYKGSEDLLRIAGTIADTADSLYKTMDEKCNGSKPKPKRLSED